MVRIVTTPAPEMPAPIAPTPLVPRRRQRRKMGLVRSVRCGCCLFLFLIILGLAIAGLVVVAKTGVWHIPVISNMVYRPPVVKNTVEITESDIASFSAGLKTEVTSEGYSVRLTDKELTFAIRQMVSTGNDPLFAPSVQATIHESGIEVWGLLIKPVSANVTLRVVPEVSDGTITFVIKEARVGTLSVPTAWISDTFQSYFDDFAAQLSSRGTITAVELGAGEVIIFGTVPLP